MNQRIHKIILIYLACMMYFSSTGMVYVLRTCIHSGKASISWSTVAETDCCTHEEAEEASCCSFFAEVSCCSTDADKGDDCSKEQIAYSKPDISSLEPDQSAFPVVTLLVSYYSLFPFLTNHPDLIYLPGELLRKNQPPPDDLIPTSLETRVFIGSFIC